MLQGHEDQFKNWPVLFVAGNNLGWCLAILLLDVFGVLALAFC